MLIEDFDFDAEVSLLEAAGAGPEKYLMHANAHSMASQKYLAACKSLAGGVTPERKKLMRALGKKHEAAAKALTDIANHHTKATFAATDKKRQALRNPGMKQSMNEETLDEARLLKHSDGWYSVRRTNHYAKNHSVEHLDDQGNWIPDSGMVHSSDWHGIRHSNKEKAMANARKHGVELKEDLDETFSKFETGEGDRRTKEQAHFGKHLSKTLGTKHVHVTHANKGGLTIHSKHEGGEHRHMNEVSKHLESMGVEHRREGGPNHIGPGRSKSRIYIPSWTGHEHGAKMLRAEHDAKPENIEADRDRLLPKHEGYEMKTGDLIRLAIENKPLEFRGLVWEMLVDRAHDALEQLRDGVMEAVAADADNSDEDDEDEGEASPGGGEDDHEGGLEEDRIDELSRKTLGSYAKKANQAAIDTAHEMGIKKAEEDEITRFTNRLGKNGSFATRDELHKNADVDHESNRKRYRTLGKRVQGHKRAIDRLTKEDYIPEAQDGEYLSKAGAEAARQPYPKGPCPMEKEPEPAGKRFPTGRQKGDFAQRKLGQVKRGARGSPGRLGDEDRLENSRN